MIENISYEDMQKYSEELMNSVNIIRDLIQDKDSKELEKFTQDVESYANYLSSSVELYSKAEEAISELKSNIGE